jgi:hypothetical protein
MGRHSYYESTSFKPGPTYTERIYTTPISSSRPVYEEISAYKRPSHAHSSYDETTIVRSSPRPVYDEAFVPMEPPHHHHHHHHYSSSSKPTYAATTTTTYYAPAGGHYSSGNGGYATRSPTSPTNYNKPLGGGYWSGSGGGSSGGGGSSKSHYSDHWPSGKTLDKVMSDYRRENSSDRRWEIYRDELRDMPYGRLS